MAKMEILPWVCAGCGNKWVDNLMVTWEQCPECEGEAQHEKVRELAEDDEWYVDDPC